MPPVNRATWNAENELSKSSRATVPMNAMMPMRAREPVKRMSAATLRFSRAKRKRKAKNTAERKANAIMPRNRALTSARCAFSRSLKKRASIDGRSPLR